MIRSPWRLRVGPDLQTQIQTYCIFVEAEFPKPKLVLERASGLFHIERESFSNVYADRVIPFSTLLSWSCIFESLWQASYFLRDSGLVDNVKSPAASQCISHFFGIRSTFAATLERYDTVFSSRFDANSQGFSMSTSGS